LTYVGTTPGFDWTVLVFMTLVSMTSGVLFGLAPALRLSHARPFTALYTAGRAIGGRDARRMERVLVIGQLALALTLLSGMGLMLRDFQRLQAADLGYEPAGLLTFTVSLSAEDYPTAESRTAFMTEATRQLAMIPGLARVGATTMFPSAGANSMADVVAEGREPAPGERTLVNSRMVTPGFLEALGVPLLRGRGITAADRADAPPIVVISASLAEKLWPDEDPIGKRLRSRRASADSPWLTVVGLVGDVREFYDVEETWYLPYAQNAESFLSGRAVFALRGATRVPPQISAVREAMASVDPGLPIFDASTAEDLYASSLNRQGQAALLGSIFAAFALLLASLGIYGSISYGVSRRIREFGVRMALGSDRGTILRNVAAEGARMVLVGTIVGLAGALILSRLLASALTEVGPFDLQTYVISCAVLAVATLGAAFVPAVRATRIDPVEALRQE
jgi:putative ABC transport system permease protein